MRLSTRLARAGTRKDAPWGTVSTPIYQTAIFEHKRPFDPAGDAYNYSRVGNPTRKVLEEELAALEGGFQGFAFSSGMAAISSVFRLFAPGDHLIITEGLYGHTFALVTYLLEPAGLNVSFVDTASAAAVEAAWTERTRGLFVELPTNPLMHVADLAALAEICKPRRAHLIVDSTFLTPWALRPIELGADIVVHSATKYLAGHNDTIAGAVVVGSPALADEMGFIQMMTGAILAPQDAWLTLRGLKTLALRMERSQENALHLAQWLTEQTGVTEVHYPGLPGHPSRGLLDSQAAGYGSVVSFAVEDEARVKALLDRTELIVLAESLGGVETLITYPWSQTHANYPEAERRRLGIHERLLRLSVGIEAWEDLAADLSKGLA